MDTSVRQENNALRTVTAILMLFIAGVHYYSRVRVGDTLVNDIIYNAGRFAIPVLVLTSGYFCYSKDGHSEANIKRKAFHILFLIVIYKLFYLIFSGIYCLAGILTPEYVLMEFLVVSPGFDFACYGGTVMLEATQPIWFIYALFMIYVLWYILYRFKVDFKWTWLLAIPILIICVLFDEILPNIGVEEIGGIWIRRIGGVMYPFILLPFFVIGYYLHKYKETIDAHVTNWMIWVALLGSAVVMVLESLFLPGSAIIYVGSIVVAIALFMGTFRVPPEKYRIKPLEYMGRYLTVWMYVFFGAANFAIRSITQYYSDNFFFCEVLGPFLAIALDIVMAFGFHCFLDILAAKKAAKKVSVSRSLP